MMQQHICVYCGAANGLDTAYVETAREAGKAIAQRGHVLVYGGGNRGLMGEVARATTEYGGRIIGIIPRMLTDVEQTFSEANKLHISDGLRDRKSIMESYASGFLILPGGLGTLDELFEILTQKQLRTLSKPIVLVNTRGYYDPLVHLFEHIHNQGFLNGQYPKFYHVAPDALSGIEYIEQYKPVAIESRFQNDSKA
ncbi:MAG: TIGR00730 family Rossman fold protein [Anaerolineae bacterium]|nr:TIGR00730 family Rossman fold protein [Anaerolineae bacterium]